MVARKARQGKSQFLRRFLERDVQANHKAANEAWRRAGNSGGISSSLFYKAKADANASSAKRATNGAQTVVATAPRAKPAPAPSKRSPEAASQRAPLAPTNGLESTRRSTGKVSSGQTTYGSDVLDEIEAEIDRLIFKIMGIHGLSEVEKALRHARRLLIRSHHD